MKKIWIVTNNSKVNHMYSHNCDVVMVSTFIEVLEKVRDLVHEGGVLLTHPMASSLKPNQTPYRSVILEMDGKKALDMGSLTMIEQAIETYTKFMALHQLPEYKDAVKEDFKTIDASLMESAFVHWKGGGLK